jgi:hypothetical protein
MGVFEVFFWGSMSSDGAYIQSVRDVHGNIVIHEPLTISGIVYVNCNKECKIYL